MKKSLVWKILLGVGICPLVLPLVLGIYHVSIESWKLTDWLVLYSFLYWPTYLAGVALIAISVYKLRK